MDREKYQNLIEANKVSKTCHAIKAKNIKDFVTDSVDNAFDLLVHIGDNFDQCTASEWLLGFDMYVNDVKGNSVGRFKNKYGMGRGTIIEFDAFGDVGTEQKKRRPAIVLLENGNKGVIVAPIGKAAYESGKEYHVSIEKELPEQGNMKENCGIKLEQIRYIDKNRVTNKFEKVTDANKLNELDRKLVKNISKNFYEEHEKLIEQNENLRIEMVKVTKEVSDKDEEIAKLRLRIRMLESELLDSMQENDNIS